MIRSTQEANPASNAISKGGYFLGNNEAKASIGTHNDIWECIHCPYTPPWRVTSTQGKLDTRYEYIKPVLSATLMATEQHPGNNILPTQHSETKYRSFQRWSKIALSTVTAWNNLGLHLLPLNIDSWIFFLIKNLPEFLNLEHPIFLGRHAVDL
jgi:hypothetical protein